VKPTVFLPVGTKKGFLPTELHSRTPFRKIKANPGLPGIVFVNMTCVCEIVIITVIKLSYSVHHHCPLLLNSSKHTTVATNLWTSGNILPRVSRIFSSPCFDLLGPAAEIPPDAAAPE